MRARYLCIYYLLRVSIDYTKYTMIGKKYKEKNERKWTCIAPFVSISTTKRSYVDHIELRANTPHLPFLRISIR